MNFRQLVPNVLQGDILPSRVGPLVWRNQERVILRKFDIVKDSDHHALMLPQEERLQRMENAIFVHSRNSPLHTLSLAASDILHGRRQLLSLPSRITPTHDPSCY
jgi:hypothetical protein